MFRKGFKGFYEKNVNSMKKKAGLNGYVSEFFVDYNIIDISSVISVHKCLMKKHDIK